MDVLVNDNISNVDATAYKPMEGANVRNREAQILRRTPIMIHGLLLPFITISKVLQRYW
jgi:hypothetical protein